MEQQQKQYKQEWLAMIQDLMQLHQVRINDLLPWARSVLVLLLSNEPLGRSTAKQQRRCCCSCMAHACITQQRTILACDSVWPKHFTDDHVPCNCLCSLAA
jgi:hypothetical protein